jgi:hypothetical protein
MYERLYKIRNNAWTPSIARVNATLQPPERLPNNALPWAFSDDGTLMVACLKPAVVARYTAQTKPIAATVNEMLRDPFLVKGIRFDVASEMEMLMLDVLSGCMYNLRKLSDEVSSLQITLAS